MSTAKPNEALAALGDRFVVEREIGRGAHKRVFLAWDRSLERWVAIAAIPVGERADDVAPLHEARAMARIGDHPRQVAVYDVIEGPGEIFIVSRYLAGGDLRALLQRCAGPLPIARALEIAADIAAALAHAHRHDLIHQDVKPQNVFFDDAGRALLGDLGLARILTSNQSGTEGTSGSVAYMAPEQFLNGSAGRATDIYSLGCILFEMLTGHLPLHAATAAEHVALLLYGPPPPRPSSLRTEVPPILDDLLVQTLTRDPANRLASGDDLAASLLAIKSYLLRRHAAAGAAAAASPADPDAAPLVGADHEMHLAAGWIAELRDGRSRTILVEDDAGSGKTRLLRHLAETATTAGCTVLDASRDSSGALPFAAITDALRVLLTRIPEHGPLARLRRMIELDDAADAAAMETSGDEFNSLAAAITMLLHDVAADRPIVLIVDDLHLLDSASVRLVEHLANVIDQPQPPPMILAVATRPCDAGVLADTVRRLRRSRTTTSMAIHRLDDNAVARLLESRGVARPATETVRFVAAAGAGLPALTHEAVSYLLARSGIEIREGFSALRPAMRAEALPASVDALTTPRLAELPPQALTALRVLAACEHPLSVDQLARALDVPTGELSPTLAAAAAARLVRVEGSVYRIAHSQLRQAIYSATDPEARQAIHHRIALLLLADGDRVEAIDSAALAHHLVRAGNLADAAATLHWCAAAGDRAIHLFAWPEAADLFESALLAAGRLTAAPMHTVGDLHRKAGIAHLQLYDKGPAIHHLERAIDSFRSAGDRRGMLLALQDRARAAVQSGMVSYGQLQSVEPLEECLDSAEITDDNLRASVLGTLAESYWVARRPDRATELSEEALCIAREIGNDRLLAEMCIHRAIAHLQYLELHAAVDTYEEGIAAARATNHLTALEQCLTRLAMVSLLLGRTANAESTAAEAQRLNRMTQSGDESWTFSTLTTLAVIRGDLDAAERNAAAGIALLERAKYPWSAAIIAVALAAARAQCGDQPGADAAIDKLLLPGFVLVDPAPLESYVVQYRALAAALAGNAAVPTPPLAIDGELDLVVGFDFAHVPTIGAAVELWGLGRGERPSDRCLAALDFAAARGMVFSVGWPFFLPRLLAVAALQDSRLDDAARHAQRALDTARRIRAVPEVARSAILLATALRRRAGDGDVARAERVIDRNRAAIDRHVPPAIVTQS